MSDELEVNEDVEQTDDDTEGHGFRKGFGASTIEDDEGDDTEGHALRGRG